MVSDEVSSIFIPDCEDAPALVGAAVAKQCNELYELIQVLITITDQDRAYAILAVSDVLCNLANDGNYPVPPTFAARGRTIYEEIAEKVRKREESAKRESAGGE